MILRVMKDEVSLDFVEGAADAFVGQGCIEQVVTLEPFIVPQTKCQHLVARLWHLQPAKSYK